MRSPRDILNSFFHVGLLKSCRGGGCALLIAIAMASWLGACSKYTVNKPAVRVAVATQLLETQIVVRGKGSAKWHYFDFKVPEVGSATLTLSNGARTNAPLEERLDGAEVTLNGKKVIKPEEVNQRIDVLEVPVGDRLRVGGNRLGVRLCESTDNCADPGKRLSVQIDAPANKVVLTPVLNPLVPGREVLRAQATVTGLGVPVKGAKVRFEVLDLGAVPEKLASTGRTGTATAFLRGFSAAGRGRLKASVVGTDPMMSHEIPIHAVKAAKIKIAHGVKRLSVENGEEVDLIVVVNMLQGKEYGVKVEHKIEPDSSGIKFSSDQDLFKSRALQSFLIKRKVSGIKVGIYTVTTTATIKATGDKWSDTMTINVVDPSAPDPLFLDAPFLNPPGILPGASSTVTVLALVDGTSTPPEKLFLDEVDVKGKPLSEPVDDCEHPNATCLFDDGSNKDKHKGDFAYTGTLDIPSSDEAEKYFRVRAEYFGKTVISGIRTFSVTPFPLKARRSKGPLVDDRFFADEVILKVRPGVLPDHVKTIAAAADGGQVVGVIPPLRTYLVQITGDGKASGVLKAIAAMSAFDKEVERVSPNHLFKSAAYDPVNKPEDPAYCDCDPYAEPGDLAYCGSAGTLCTCTEPQCQWYLPRIGAREAWQLAGGGDPHKAVAVIDDGVECDHDDLKTKCPRNDPGASDHGTQVAGIIAATANNKQHIAGIAWNTMLYTYNSEIEYTIAQSITSVDGILSEPDAKIINISQFRTCPVDRLESAVSDAINDIDNQRLVVTASGNGCPEASSLLTYCPAAYNSDAYPNIKDGLLVVGATNQTNDPQYYQADCDTKHRIDLYAPGIDIRSIGINAVVNDGTSMATAIASGAAAVLWALWDSEFGNPRGGTTLAKAVHDRLIKTATIPLTEDVAYDHCQSIEGTGTTTCGRLDLFDAIKPPVFSIAPTEALEGAPIIFTVTRTGEWPVDQKVDYATSISADDTAVDLDFTAVSDTLTFREGHVTKTITINTAGDTQFEPDETFTVTLSNPTNGAVLGVASARGTIRNDDAEPPLAPPAGLRIISRSLNTGHNFF